VKAILFDFGGTIDTDGVHWSEKFGDLYARFAPHVPKKDVERAFVESDRMLLADPSVAGLTFEATLARQWRMQFGLLHLPASGGLLEEMSRVCYQEVRQTIAQARDVLSLLAPHYRLGVVSNFTGNLEIVCREFRLEKLFSVFIDSAVVGIRKPDSAIFALALERLGIDAATASVVGDSYERDIVPAKRLGCSTVWLQGKSWSAPPSTEAADRTIHRFSEIQEIFLH
jgi:putative hydrolase of the HAD superfamily